MIAKNPRLKKATRYQNVFFSVFLGALFLAVVSFLIFSNVKISQKRGELLNRVESLQDEIKTLEEEKEKLEANINQTKSESYWEERIREQGYKKPGEEAVVVLPPEENRQPPVKEQKNFFQKLLEKLGF